MYIEQIEELNSKLYRSGMLVISRPVVNNTENRVVNSKKRKYTIKRERVRSASIDLWLRRRSKHLLFITFTFPFDVSEYVGSLCWDRLLNNLRNNYKLHKYVWVKEYQKNGRLHYHILIDRNYINIKNLQATWNNIIFNNTGVKPDFNNSVRLGSKPIVKGFEKIARYLSKYITKNDNGVPVEYTRRAYSFDSGAKISRSLTQDELKRLWLHTKPKLLVDETFFNVYRLDNFFDVPDYWVEIPDI